MIRSHGLKSRVCRSLMMSVGLLVLAGCASQRFEEPELSPQQARAQIVRLMPADVSDRQVVWQPIFMPRLPRRKFR